MRSLLTLASLLLALLTSAQIARKELRTDTGTIVLHFFKNGGVSTKEWTNSAPWGQGTSWAYRADGSELTRHQTRRFAGHASATFHYHPNGGVSRVEYSEAPDGGIQWYKSTTAFDEDGQQTGFTEQGRDNYGPIPSLHTIAPPARQEPPAKQEVVVEQRLFANEVFVVNPTRSACRVLATPRSPSPALPAGTWTMAPGDTIRIGSYTMGEIFTPWQGHLTLDIHEVVLKRERVAKAEVRTDEVEADPEHRRYYVVIEGWAKAGKEKQAAANARKRWLFW